MNFNGLCFRNGNYLFIVPSAMNKEFVDDIITAVPEEEVEFKLQLFNNNNIQFTVEKELEKSVPLLDTTIIIRRDDNAIILDWYHKLTNSDIYK